MFYFGCQQPMAREWGWGRRSLTKGQLSPMSSTIGKRFSRLREGVHAGTAVSSDGLLEIDH